MREVLGEVLSDLFTKHLPREKSSNQRDFERESEVVRSFSRFLFLRELYILFGHTIKVFRKMPCRQFPSIRLATWFPAPEREGLGWGLCCILFHFTSIYPLSL